MIHKTPNGERIKQLRAESRKPGAALVAVSKLEGLEELVDIRTRLQERREAARARVAALHSSGRPALSPPALQDVSPHEAHAPELLPETPVPRKCIFPGISRRGTSCCRTSPALERTVGEFEP
jgi:hypothetical protein